MKLTNMQYCRAFAFVEMLKLTVRNRDGSIVADDQPLPSLAYRPYPDGMRDALGRKGIDPIAEIQDGTVQNATIFAAQNFPELSFPDETERETAPIVEAVEVEAEAEPTEAELAEAEAELAINA